MVSDLLSNLSRMITDNNYLLNKDFTVFETPYLPACSMMDVYGSVLIIKDLATEEHLNLISNALKKSQSSEIIIYLIYSNDLIPINAKLIGNLSKHCKGVIINGYLYNTPKLKKVQERIFCNGFSFWTGAKHQNPITFIEEFSLERGYLLKTSDWIFIDTDGILICRKELGDKLIERVEKWILEQDEKTYNSSQKEAHGFSNTTFQMLWDKGGFYEKRQIST